MRTTVSWRHVVLGLGFLVLAGVRASQGAPVWAAVFALAGAANAWLAFRDPRAEAEPTPGVADADPREIERERARCLAAQRRWQVLGLAGALVAAGLLLLEPPLAVLGGAAALFAVFRARRVRRYAATLTERPAAGRSPGSGRGAGRAPQGPQRGRDRTGEHDHRDHDADRGAGRQDHGQRHDHDDLHQQGAWPGARPCRHLRRRGLGGPGGFGAGS